MIQGQSEAAEVAERVGEEEQEVGISPQVVTAGKRSRDVSVFPAGTTTSLVRPGDQKRTS